MSAPGFELALAQLNLAYGKLTLPDWQAHAEALADAVGGLTELLLHVDACTGTHHAGPIYLDPNRVVLGLLPEVVAPLVRLLERQTRALDEALEQGWMLPPNETKAWSDWHLRLGRYAASLASAQRAGAGPSNQLWIEVTAPLIQGIYPEDFGTLGITNPAVPSKPDVATVPSTAFMVALQTQEVGHVQAWLLHWRESVTLWLRETTDAIRARYAALVTRVETGARRTVAVVAVVTVLGGLGLLAWRAANDKPASSRRRPPEIS